MTVPSELWEVRFGLLGMLNAVSGLPVGADAFSRYAIHLFEHAETFGLQTTPSPAKRRGQKLAIFAASCMVAPPEGHVEELTAALKRELRLLDAVIERCAHQTCRIGATVAHVHPAPHDEDYAARREPPLAFMGETFHPPIAGK